MNLLRHPVTMHQRFRLCRWQVDLRADDADITASYLGTRPRIIHRGVQTIRGGDLIQLCDELLRGCRTPLQASKHVDHSLGEWPAECRVERPNLLTVLGILSRSSQITELLE